MLIGYARVSTDDQKLTVQLDALKKAGCKRIFEDTESGAKADRPGLLAMLDVLREGDTLVIWRLDRLSRSMKDLLRLADQLQTDKIGLISLHESFDTTTPTGVLIFHVLSALAEFQRNLIREQTKAGLASATARGRSGGRPLILNKKKRMMVVKMYRESTHSVVDICEMVGISKPTLYKYVQLEKMERELKW